MPIFAKPLGDNFWSPKSKSGFDYNKSLVSLATHSQSRLNSFQTDKDFFCIALPGHLDFISFLGELAVRSVADETSVIVKTLICPLQKWFCFF